MRDKKAEETFSFADLGKRQQRKLKRDQIVICLSCHFRGSVSDLVSKEPFQKREDGTLHRLLRCPKCNSINFEA